MGHKADLIVSRWSEMAETPNRLILMDILCEIQIIFLMVQIQNLVFHGGCIFIEWNSPIAIIAK